MTDPNPHLAIDSPADWNLIADEVWDQVLAQVESSPLQIALVVTGGGSGAMARCFARAGASRHFVDAAVPYSRRALSAYLNGGDATPSVCRPVAESMACAARRRAADWGSGEGWGTVGLSGAPGLSGGIASSEPSVVVPAGIALTAALPTSMPSDRSPDADPMNPSRSSHVWISAATSSGVESWHYRLPLGMDRGTAESVAESLVAAAVAWAIDPPFASQIRSKFPFQPE